MTLDEVIAAGEGDVVPFTDEKEGSPDIGVVLAKQPYIASDIMFDACFFFRNGKLGAVSLRPIEKDQAFLILQRLKESYVTPAAENTMNMICNLKVISWRDQKRSSQQVVSFFR